MTFDALASALTARPRVPLALQPTPLEDAVRLREALGGRAACPRILVKRDDLTGLGLGGNKARKLEFLMGEALAERATTVVTTGAVQSNHARMTAAAARRCGLGCDLVLTATDDAPPIEGNLLLDSRKLLFPATSLFFALGGPRRSGISFIKELYEKGVHNFVVDKKPISKKCDPTQQPRH